MPPVTPNSGRFGSFGIAKQATAGTAVAPTHFLRWSGGTPPIASVDVKDDNYANASLFPLAGRAQGWKMDGKNVQFEAEHAGLVTMLELVAGANLASNVITPSWMNFGPNMPLTPVTVEANAVGAPTRVVDAQFHRLALTINDRANVTAQADYMGATSSDMTDAAAAVIPTANIYQFKDHFIKIDGIESKPESGSITFDTQIEPIDASQGHDATAADFICGFERNGPVMLEGQFSMAGVPANLLAAYRAQSTLPLEWTLRKYGALTGDPLTYPTTHEVKVVVPNAQFSLVEPPFNLERVVTPISWKAVSLAGEVPYTIEITQP